MNLSALDDLVEKKCFAIFGGIFLGVQNPLRSDGELSAQPDGECVDDPASVVRCQPKTHLQQRKTAPDKKYCAATSLSLFFFLPRTPRANNVQFQP